jgi:hypothetical protein
MFVRESVLSQTMIRIQILPVMGCTQRDNREIRGLFDSSLWHPERWWWAASITVAPQLTLGRLRIPASGSKPDIPSFAPDPAAAGIASCGPEPLVSAADRAARAHSGIMANFS